MSCLLLLTIDVEDWFQVENFKPWIPFSSWPSCELRVEKNTHRLLDLLDGQRSAVSDQQSGVRGQGLVSTNPIKLMKPIEPTNPINSSNPTNPKNPTNASNPKNSPKASFFVLGWIAERLPHLVREIHSRGHEVASHGYYHNLCNQQSPDALKKDLTDSKNLLEDIIGAPVYGYRTPSFAVNGDVLKIIEDCGYLYDSSYNSFSMHGRYGHLDISQDGARGIALQIADPRSPIPDPGFYELPISNIKLGNRILPWGGGAYFRLTPYPLFKMGVRSILKKQKAYMLYLHPWEIDPQQPRVDRASRFFKFRHYANLDKTASKLSSFVQAFKECNFVTCHQYLEENL